MIKFIPLLFGAIITASIVVSTPAFAAPVSYTLNTSSYKCTPDTVSIKSLPPKISGDPSTQTIGTVPIQNGTVSFTRDPLTLVITVSTFNSTTIKFGNIKVLTSSSKGFSGKCTGSATYSVQ